LVDFVVSWGRSPASTQTLARFLDLQTYVIAVLLHPGDLSYWQLAGIIGVFFALCMLPIIIVGFVIYRVIVGHSQDSGSVTLSLRESRPTDS
jgi:hypothetical protein